MAVGSSQPTVDYPVLNTMPPASNFCMHSLLHRAALRNSSRFLLNCVVLSVNSLVIYPSKKMKGGKY